MATVNAYAKYTVQDARFLADISNGNVFHRSVSSETVADDGAVGLYVQTNNEGSNIPHSVRFRINANGLAKFTLYEGSSANAGKTGVSWLNYNRASPKTTVATLSTVTSWSGGSVIWELMFGSSGPHGAGVTGSEEFILADSSNYYFELKNLSGGAGFLFMAIDYVDRS